MGALTIKPQAYQTRPWERALVEVSNLLEGWGKIFFHFRGARINKITATTWLADRVRFSFDGFRRQRLICPVVEGSSATWSAALAVWFTLAWGVTHTFVTDGFTGWTSWSNRRYRLVQGLPVGGVIAVDRSVQAIIFHGAYALVQAQPLLSLPRSNPYEEEGLLLGPADFLGLRDWSSSTRQALTHEVQFDGLWATTGLAQSCAAPILTKTTLQVSPVQYLLLE